MSIDLSFQLFRHLYIHFLGLVGNLKGEAVEKEDEIEILKKAAKHSVQSIK